jgi:subtilisin-like proprotein convertase family protein
MSLWAPGNTSWSNLTRPATGAGLWAGEEIKNGVRTDYLGVFGDATMTLWLEGEVWLDASPNQAFKVNGDAVGFVELASPGTTAFAKIAEDATVAVPTTSPGWYPVRIGFSNNDGTFDFTFTHSDDGGAQVPWTRDRLRARTSELNGALRTVFGHQILGGGQNGMPPVLHFEQSDLLHTTSLSPPPQGAGNDDWSAHYLGQIYIVQGGDYALQITSDDGNRGRLGATTDQLHWVRDEGIGAPPLPIKQYPATLAAGWNDLTVDYNQVAGMRSLRVQIQGPDFPGVVDVPRDRLRPVELAEDRLAFGADETNRNVNNGGGAGNPTTDTMTVAGYAAETVGSIELSYQINSSRWSSLKVDLETPGGTRVTLADPGALQNGDHVLQFTIPATDTSSLATLLGGPAKGDWKLRVYDVNPGGGGNSTLESAQLTLHTQGGPDKVARSATWTSVPIDAGGNLVAIDGITWVERAPMEASVKVQFRACQQANCSDDPPWSSPVTSGSGANVAPQRYLQLRVEMASNGTLEPELRSLAVVYRHHE